MRILLVRHGQSEGNVDSQAYIDKGDQNVGLSDHGWQQAIHCGEFFRDLYQGYKKWPVLYLSSYERTKQTLSGILHGMGGAIAGAPKLREDVRLIEKHFGARSILRNSEGVVDEDFANNFSKLARAVYKNDPFTTPNLLGESSKMNLMAIKSFIDGTFSRDRQEGYSDFLFVVHGAVIKDFLMSWTHLPMKSRSDIPAIGNCDVVSIEGASKNWNIRKIYDGEKAVSVDADLLAELQPYTVDDLPPVPDSFKFDQ